MIVRVLFLLVALSAAHAQLYDRLYSHLLKGPRRGARETIPVASHEDTLNVSLSMSLIEITSLDPSSGDAVLEFWKILKWTDGRMTWDPESFDNITKLRMPQTNFWNPDVVLYNGHSDSIGQNAVVSSDGSILVVPPTTVKVRCDVTNYHDDGTVTCRLKWGSWTYDGHTMDLHFSRGEGIDLADFVPGRWDIVSTQGKREVKYYACCPESYIDLRYTLVLKDLHMDKGFFNVF